MLYGLDEPPLQRDNALAAIRLIIAAVLLMGCVFFVPSRISNAEAEVPTNNPSITPPASPQTQVDADYDSRSVLPRKDSIRGQLDGSDDHWTMTIEEFIRMHARGAGVDEDLAVAIIRCEGDRNLSGVMQGNAQGASSSYGPWQIIDGTWRSTVAAMGFENADRSDYATNVEVGIYLLKTQGVKPWSASRHCWQR